MTISQIADPDNDSTFYYHTVGSTKVLATMVFVGKPGEEYIIKVFIGNDEQDVTFSDWEDAEAYISRALGQDVK